MKASRVRSLVATVVAAGLCLATVLATPAVSGAANESSTTSTLKTTTSTAAPKSSTTTTIRSETATYLNRATPGVYVTEIAGLGNHMVLVHRLPQSLQHSRIQSQKGLIFLFLPI